MYTVFIIWMSISIVSLLGLFLLYKYDRLKFGQSYDEILNKIDEDLNNNQKP